MPELICRRLHFERVSPHIYCSLSHALVFVSLSHTLYSTLSWQL